MFSSASPSVEATREMRRLAGTIFGRDALRWFDYVHTDDPWAQVPAHAPERPLPARCQLPREAKALH